MDVPILGSSYSTSHINQRALMVAGLVSAAILRDVVACAEGRKNCRLLRLIREQHQGHEIEQGLCLRKRAVVTRVWAGLVTVDGVFLRRLSRSWSSYPSCVVGQAVR